MKKLFFILLILALTALASPASSGDLTIDRTWSTAHYGYALVTYINNTARTFKYFVTIQCIAYNAAGNKVGMNERSFFPHEYGPIKPGFEGTLEIPIELHGAQAASIECTCRER